ncbi:uncharacterized protein B0H18DRAFT_1206488 [Fomitopsis serialis]|uniref:uncharacterized protein n=1 Tax=Fomitopsis serialis TaxID=139415 RepID=UPI002008CD61|nr:uncharacterized protein B0H18DRAFT_1206488 [Neoantrodia serialis]KAH9937696.1 hypothetical protein B0H18DRAFT_1206488 [Neoantrodia serialis]
MFRRALTAALPRSSFAASRLSSQPARHVLPAASRAARSLTGRRAYAAASTPRSCPQCSAPLTTPLPVCTKCYWISNIPAEMTYHEMLGVPYEPNPFVVDTVAIKQELRQLQTVVHPDRWVGKERVKQDAAAVMSSRVNEALHRLSNPLRRVEYILQREGYPTSESENLEDPEMLMETMEMREQIEGAESKEEIEQVRAANAQRLEETMQEVTELIGRKDWPAAKVAAIKLKYLQGIENAAEAYLPVKPLFPFAARCNMRLVALNARDYRGSSSFNDSELAALESPDLQSQRSVVRACGRELAAFLVWFIEHEKLPPLSGSTENGAGRRGGISVLGWLFGSASSLL